MKMKLYIIQTGCTKVPYGQFFGGLEGWSGLKGKFKFATDKKHYILVPINCFLIDHPSAGPILVDTGINWEQARKHKEYYTGLTGLVTDEDEYVLQPEEEINMQLQALGYQCRDVQNVILTHLHEDHIGGLKYFPQAKVLVSSPEWLSRHKKFLGVIPQVYPKSIAMIADLEIISYSSGQFHSFPASRDVFGDGSIVLLPTPGHSSGHLSVLLQGGDYQVLLCGDSLYTLRHLAVEQVRSIILDASWTEDYIRSIRLTQELHKALPELVLIPGHDPTEYHNEYLKAFFRDGILAPEELKAIKKYEKKLLPGDYHLPQEALPEFLPAAGGGTVGSIK